MYKNIFLPASILAGTIIGAGMFSLPFIFLKSGLMAGFSYLLLFALIYSIIYFIYSDIILRTEGSHRFVGYSKIYLGKLGFYASLFTGLIQLFFVLTIYLILSTSFIKIFIGGSYLNHLLFFWILGSLIILFKIRKIALYEFFIVAGMSLIIFLVFLFGGFNIDFNLLKNISFGHNPFAAIGPILFALSGTLAVPEIISYFKESGVPLNFLKKGLVLGSFLSALAYTAFVVGILGLSKVVSDDAVSGLVGSAPAWLLMVLGILGFLSLISSYIVVGLNVRKILEYDFNFSEKVAMFSVVFIPPLLYFLGIQDFIKAVSFMGSVFIPFEILLLTLIWIKMDKLRPKNDLFSRKFIKFFLPVIFAIFSIVLVYVIIN